MLRIQAFTLALFCCCLATSLGARPQGPLPAPWIEEIRPDYRNVRGLNYLALYPNVPAVFEQFDELSSTSFWHYYDGYYYSNDPASQAPQTNASAVEQQLRWMKQIGVNTIRVWMSYPLWKYHNDFLTDPKVNPNAGENEYIKRVDDFMRLCGDLNMHVIPVLWGTSAGAPSNTFARFGDCQDPEGTCDTTLATTQFPNIAGAPETQLFSGEGTGDFNLHWYTGQPIQRQDALEAIEMMAMSGWHGNPGTFRLRKWEAAGSASLNEEATGYVKQVVSVLANSISTLMIDIMNEPVFEAPDQFLINGTLGVINAMTSVPGVTDLPITVGAGGPSIRWESDTAPPAYQTIAENPDIDVLSAHTYIAFREGLQQWIENTAGYRPATSSCPPLPSSGPCYAFNKPILVSEIGAPGEGTPYTDAINLCLNVPRPDLGVEEKGVGFMIWTTMLSPAIPLASAEGMFYIDGEVRNLAACQAFIDAAVSQGIDRANLTLPRAKAVDQGTISDDSRQTIYQNQLPFSVGYDNFEFLARALDEVPGVVSYPGGPCEEQLEILRMHSVRLHEIVNGMLALRVNLERVRSVFVLRQSDQPAYITNITFAGSPKNSLKVFGEALLVLKAELDAIAHLLHPDRLDEYPCTTWQQYFDDYVTTMQNGANLLKFFGDVALCHLKTCVAPCPSHPAVGAVDPEILAHGPYTSFGVNLIENGGADINQHGLFAAVFDKPLALEVASWRTLAQTPILMQEATAEYAAAGSPGLPPDSLTENHRYFTTPITPSGGAATTLIQEQLLWDLSTEILAERVGFELHGAFSSSSGDAQLTITFLNGTGGPVSAGGVHSIGSTGLSGWELDTRRGRVPSDAAKVEIELSLPPGTAADDLVFRLVEAVGANRLVNPGSEVLLSRDCGTDDDHEISGWNDTSGSIISQDYCIPGAQAPELGLSRFFGGAGYGPNETRSMSQRVPLGHLADWITGQTVTADLSAWAATLSGGNQVVVQLTFEDDSDPPTVFAGASLTPLTGAALNQLSANSIPVPPSACWAVIEVAFTVGPGETVCDAVVDGVSLKLQHP